MKTLLIFLTVAVVALGIYDAVLDAAAAGLRAELARELDAGKRQSIRIAEAEGRAAALEAKAIVVRKAARGARRSGADRGRRRPSPSRSAPFRPRFAKRRSPRG